MSEETKGRLLAWLGAGLLAFQCFLGASAIKTWTIDTSIAENKEERIKQLQELRDEHRALHVEVAKLRDLIGEHRLRDAEDDRSR